MQDVVDKYPSRSLQDSAHQLTWRNAENLGVLPEA